MQEGIEPQMDALECAHAQTLLRETLRIRLFVDKCAELYSLGKINVFLYLYNCKEIDRAIDIAEAGACEPPLCSLSQHWVKSWAGRGTSSTQCKIGGMRSKPAFSWGWFGPCGISSRSRRLTDRRHGSPGGVSSRWRHGFL